MVYEVPGTRVRVRIVCITRKNTDVAKVCRICIGVVKVRIVVIVELQRYVCMFTRLRSKGTYHTYKHMYIYICTTT